MNKYKFERTNGDVILTDNSEGLSEWEAFIGRFDFYPAQGVWLFQSRHGRLLCANDLAVISKEIERLNSEVTA